MPVILMEFIPRDDPTDLVADHFQCLKVLIAQGLLIDLEQ